MQRATLIRNVKGDFGNPLLPPAPATVSRRRRRLQVEKSPVGRNGSETFQGRPPPPKCFTTGTFTAWALCALQSRGSAAAEAGASLAPPRAHSNRLWPRPAPSPSGTYRTESELGWKVWWGCSKGRLTVARWLSGRQHQTITGGNWNRPWLPFLFLRGSCQEWGQKGGGAGGRVK